MTKRGRVNMGIMVEFLRFLEDDKFDFKALVSEHDEKGCGTVCCAIGWTPALFPDVASWDEEGFLFRNVDGQVEFDGWINIARDLFDIPRKHVIALFSSYEVNDSQMWGGGYKVDGIDRLSSEATATQLADTLEKYMELMDENK